MGSSHPLHLPDNVMVSLSFFYRELNKSGMFKKNTTIVPPIILVSYLIRTLSEHFWICREVTGIAVCGWIVADSKMVIKMSTAGVATTNEKNK